VGIIMMAFALVLTLIAVALAMLLRDVPEQAAASETKSKTKSSLGSLIRGESPIEPWVEKARSLPTPEVSKDEANPDPSRGEPKPTLKPVSEAEPRSQFESRPQPGAQVQAEPKAGQRSLPAGESDWSRPTHHEIETANGPRHYKLPAGAIMSLTIEAIGIYGAPVFDSAGPMALAKGVAHLPDTSLPWSPTPHRNVYLAGHRMGYRGTWSRMIFYNLGKLGEGDRVVLKDRQGRTYKYRVIETFLVEPTDSWVTGQVRGRDMLTLQTCTPIPTFEKRLIVRAERL
jgi:sortase A